MHAYMNRTFDMFRSLRSPNYRRWAFGAIVSNVGTWMQRTAQDWIVLAQLTDRSATAVGTVMALQYAPLVLLLPLTGLAADRLDRRKLLLATQTAMALLALSLGILTITGWVRLWHVYVFAFLLGCVTAFDAPVRHAFVGDLVGEKDLGNAVALNSTSFNSARMIGPAVAGALIAKIGTGWVFLVNAASFLPVLVAIGSIQVASTHRERSADRGSLADGFRYVWNREDLRTILVMIFLVGTFGINFPIFLSTMSVSVYRKGANEFGLLTSFMAVGSVAGALLAARRRTPGIGVLVTSGALFGVGLALAALAPSFALFGVALVLVGVSAQTFTTTANSTIQIASDPRMRGRAVSIFLAVALGATPIGAPIVGRVADVLGPRWGVAVGAASGFVAALVGLRFLSKKIA